MLTPTAKSLAELIARRRQVVEMLGMEANRLHQARNPRVQRMLKTTLTELDRDIDDTHRAITGLASCR